MQPRVVLCPKCHTQNAPDEQYCKNCGSKLCPNCHSVISPQSRICPSCGWQDRSWKPPDRIQHQSAASKQYHETFETKHQYICSQCGTSISDPSSTKCPKCGFLGSVHHEGFELKEPDTESKTETITSTARPKETVGQPFPEIPTKASQNTCPKCGATVPPDSRYCKSCGYLCGRGRAGNTQRQATSASLQAAGITQAATVYPSSANLFQNEMAASAPRQQSIPLRSPILNEITTALPRERPAPRRRKPSSDKTRDADVRERISQRPAKRFPIELMLTIVFVIALISALGYYIYDRNSNRTPSSPQPSVELSISNISVSSITQTSAVITWVTDDAATSQVMVCDPAGVCTWTDIDETLVTNHSVTLSDLEPNTKYHLTLISKDKDENEAISERDLTTSGQADTTPPVISAVSVPTTTESSATITWTTDEPATSQVEYGKTAGYGSTTTLTNSLVTSHSVTISGLDSNTKYHFKVKSEDASGNEVTSTTDKTFTTPSPIPVGTEIGDRAPDFTLSKLGGGSVTLSELRHDNIVIVNFWATWCNPCTGEMPHFQTVLDDWSGSNDLVIFAIDCAENATTVQNFIDDKGYTFTILLDSGGVASNYKRNATENGIPRTFFIDTDGIIRGYRYGNFSNTAEIYSILNTL